MRNFFLFKWFRDVSIAKKLYFTVGVMALLIGIELFALFFSINTLSSVRAYVEGEGLWSKAQKDAVYHLLKYGIGQDERDYLQFKEFMKVPLGDGKTRKELIKENPDWEIARRGFIEGRNHPDDVDGMIKLFRRFNEISYINKAIYYWGEAEPLALKLIPIGDSLHVEINSASPSQEKINNLLEEINPLTEKITVSEDNFSYTLAEGSRWLEGLVLKILFSIALTVEISGLFLAISVSRGIQNGLAEIIHATDTFAKGDLKTRARVFSHDEIGLLANSFNNMSDQLEKNISELSHAQNKFKGLLESAPDAIIIVGPSGKIKLVNAQTEKLFEYERNEVLLQQFDLLITEQNKRLAGENRKYLHGLLNGRDMTIDVIGRKKSGNEFPAEITLSPLQTEDGLMTSVAIRDISDRKHIKELESKNKELEQFAYIASHDLQEPLNTITSFISLVEEDKKMDKETATYIGYIKESAARMTELITDILEYSRIGGKSHIELTDCNKVVEKVLDDMKASLQESKAEIKYAMLPTLKGYPVELRLLFQNLLSNAIKFRKKNIKPRIEINSTRENDRWHFTIKDNGIGIDKKFENKIFTIFQRLNSARDYEGTGIGLAHCKKIVELHGGKIWFESEAGAGSTFHFTIKEND